MGYSFKWILEHLSQSFASGAFATSASYALTASYALNAGGNNGTASYSQYLGASVNSTLDNTNLVQLVDSDGVGIGYVQTIDNVTNASYANSAGNANLATYASQVSLFTTSSSTISYPIFAFPPVNNTYAQLYVNSSSFGYNSLANLLITTSSWAISASRAVSTLSSSYALTASYALNAGGGAGTVGPGTDQYIARFSGSTAIENTTFINKRVYGSFITAGGTNTDATASFIVGEYNIHASSSLRGVSFGTRQRIGAVTSSLTQGDGTVINNDYDVAQNLLSSTAIRLQFRGLTTRINRPANVYSNSTVAALYPILNGVGNLYDFLTNLDSSCYDVIIYEHSTNQFAYNSGTEFRFAEDLSVVTMGQNYNSQPQYDGFGLIFDGVLKYEKTGTTISENDSSLYTVWLLERTSTQRRANTAHGIQTTAYGTSVKTSGYRSQARGFATTANNDNTVTFGSSSNAFNYKSGIYANHGTVNGAFNAVGKTYKFGSLKITDVGGYDFTVFQSLENNDLVTFLSEKNYVHTRDYYQAIVVIPDIGYCEPIELFTDNTDVYTFAIPSFNETGPGYIIVDNVDWYDLSSRTGGNVGVPYDTRLESGVTAAPYAGFAIGVFNRADGSGSFVGGLTGSYAMGDNSFAFGRSVTAYPNATVFGKNITNNTYDSFEIGWNGTYPKTIHVQDGYVSVNTTNRPILNTTSTSINGLVVYDDLWVNQDAFIIRNVYVTGSSFLGNDLNDKTVVSGSLLVFNYARTVGTDHVTGSSAVTGSMNVTGSWSLVGVGRVTGSMSISSSLNVIGTSNVTGSNNITGSWNLIGPGRVTGSMMVSSSLQVIGTAVITGSNIITGSWQLIGSGTVSGSLIVSSSLTTVGTNAISGSLFVTGSQTNIGNTVLSGSVNITGSLVANRASLTGSLTGSFIGTGSGHFDGTFSGSNNTGVSFFGTSSWSTNASNVDITTTSTNGTYYLHFGNQSSGQDNVEVNTSLTYNPSTNQLSVGGVTGSLSGTATSVANALSQGAGITAFSYNGSSTQTVAVSGASSLSTNYVTQWNGSAFESSTIEDAGSYLFIRDNAYISGNFRVNAPSGIGLSDPAFMVDNGLVQFGTYTSPPPATAGAIYYDGTDWYFGTP